MCWHEFTKSIRSFVRNAACCISCSCSNGEPRGYRARPRVLRFDGTRTFGSTWSDISFALRAAAATDGARFVLPIRNAASALALDRSTCLGEAIEVVSVLGVSRLKFIFAFPVPPE